MDSPFAKSIHLVVLLIHCTLLIIFRIIRLCITKTVGTTIPKELEGNCVSRGAERTYCRINTDLLPVMQKGEVIPCSQQ